MKGEVQVEALPENWEQEYDATGDDAQYDADGDGKFHCYLPLGVGGNLGVKRRFSGALLSTHRGAL